MVIVRLATPMNVRKARRSGQRWIFLGKRTSLRSTCENTLGLSRHYDVTQRFHEIAEQLRQPFVDFVAEVGEIQKDRLGWFSSSFGWKDPDASDLFLLICYLKLVESLAAEPGGGQPLLILIEDRWLYCQCRRSLGHLREEIDLGPRVPLWPSRMTSLIGAVAARLRWMLAIVREYLSHSRYAQKYRGREHHTCWLYSLPHPRCFDGEKGWRDPFLGGLDTILIRSRHSVGRLIPVDPVGFVGELARRASYVYPTILELSGKSFLKSVISLWHARLESVPRVEELDVSLLARREWWADLRHASWCHHRLFYECALAAMRKYRPATLIFPYENQPWEKMLVAAARAAGIATIGYQHSTVPRFLLAYFLGKGEAASLPLPDLILTAGSQQAALLIEGGNPATRVRVAGSLRYEHFGRRYGPDIGSQAGGAGVASTKRVLVVTAHDLFLSSSLLDGLANAFPDGGRADGVSFFYRPHPTLQSVKHRAISRMIIVEGDLAPQLSTFDVVVTTGTTVGLEACFLGIPVVKYQADVLLDLDPLDALRDGAFLKASSTQLRERVQQAARSGRQEVSPRLSALAEELFPTVKDDVWVSAIDELSKAGRIPSVRGREAVGGTEHGTVTSLHV